ncbi:MAG TPA: PAS domain-containing protein, partial [Vicinamibacterales bacterium]|nr:PAS domain-containing protein [Vicinamibacterales bacterium]
MSHEPYAETLAVSYLASIMVIGNDRAPARVTWPGSWFDCSGDAARAVAGVPVHLLMQAVQHGIVLSDTDGRILAANRALADLLGVAPDALIGQSLGAWLRPAPGGGLTPWTSPSAATARHADGTECAVECAVSAVRSGPSHLLVTTVHDLTDRARLERALREVHDLTEQLRRAQKIGELGHLAGGVAHDFNNLLQIVSGHAEALVGGRLDQATRRRVLGTIRCATERAASLTRQLLAFGRRQVLLPEVVDLNATVRSLERMMSRVI